MLLIPTRQSGQGKPWRQIDKSLLDITILSSELAVPYSYGLGCHWA